MPSGSKEIYQFGRFRLDATERVLLRDGEPVSLTPKAIETLIVLVSNSGHVVEKDELMKAVWPDTFVGEDSLTRNISTLRKILDASAQGASIETLPRRGYRFRADVQMLDVDSPIVLARHARIRITTEEQNTYDRDDTESKEQFAPKALEDGFRSKGRSARTRRQLLIAATILLVAAAGLGSYFWASTKSAKRAEAGLPVKSIAVLPFKILDAGKGDEDLGVGIADTLITRLSSIRGSVVRPTRAILKYTDFEQDPAAAGQELKVESVLDGSIQRSGERIRVTVRLIKVDDGSSLWANKFDENFTNLLAVEDSISEQVATRLTLKLTGAERALLTKRYTESADAYRLYLKGRYFWNTRVSVNIDKAIRCFQQSLDFDPSFAPAYAGIADCYDVIGLYNERPPTESFPKAIEAAKRALEIDDALAEAHTSLAHATFLYSWDWAQAETEYLRAIELNPNYANAHQWYALFLSARGKPDKALAEINLARQIDPVSLIINMNVATILVNARQMDRAIEEFNKTLELNADFVNALSGLGDTYNLVGRHQEALVTLQRSERISTAAGGYKSAARITELGCTFALLGKSEEARKALRDLDQLSRQMYVPAFLKARVFNALGENEHAIELLERAYSERDGRLPTLNVDPELDNLRSDPRFQKLLRRVGLAE